MQLPKLSTVAGLKGSEGIELSEAVKLEIHIKVGIFRVDKTTRYITTSDSKGFWLFFPHCSNVLRGNSKYFSALKIFCSRKFSAGVSAKWELSMQGSFDIPFQSTVTSKM
uniref:Uncharacterized protein n=1 Tax=Strigamia maritima TaxID=126957 RepID=T1JIT0_STRMM